MVRDKRGYIVVDKSLTVPVPEMQKVDFDMFSQF